ncbi:MAG: M23 family metallopeptidase [Reyranella sp.]|uniref:M23 family metallopeptidase n=1 Tax=Reyranella sp. TaxID=1929291 RepID=UPI003D0F0505
MKEIQLVVAASIALLTSSSAPIVLDRFSEQRNAEEHVLGARDEDLPATREITADGVVVGLLDLAFVRARLNTVLIVELRQAFAAGLDLERAVHPGDAFHVRYAETRASRGAVIARRLLWAEFRTGTKGSVAIHRFRGRDHVEQLWFANGYSTRPPAMRMPLDTLTVSSKFGVRPDPFKQPPATSVKAASMVSLKRSASTKLPSTSGAGTAINAATPLAELLGLEPAGRASKEAAGGICSSCLHEGIDLAAPAGTPIHAAADGVVSGAAPNGRYGNWVRIEHTGRLTTVYGHLKEFAPGIQPGRQVARGDVIGLVGSTGHSTGAHLHFELRKDGRAVDPISSPMFKAERLQGAELERFRRQVARSLEQRRPVALP